ncbi:MAG: polysaccharide biosynthesis C-terminal domain-containing protein, partial [Chitinophagaceae bacterium]|nr:polysaccharide biosynthesis C-terminal domain-containing protein [Chitinophagaceae bacterium]
NFFRGLWWLILLNLIIKPVWIFGIDRQVQNIVGHVAYGSYFGAFNLSIVLSFLTDAGLTNMMNRQMAAENNLNLKQLLLVKSGLACLYAIAMFLIASLVHIPNLTIVVSLIIVQILTSFFVFFRNVITARQYFITDAWLSVVDKSLMILICGFFLYTPVFNYTFDIELFLRIQIICTLFAVGIALLILYRNNTLSNGNKIEVNNILRATLPFAFIILLMSAHYRLDGFLLERIHTNGKLETGIYAAAYRLLDAGNMIGYLAASFLVPFVALNRNEQMRIESIVINIRHFLFFPAILAVTYGISFAPWLQEILYHTTSEYQSLVLQLCIASLPAYYLVHVYGSVLTAIGELKIFITILLASVVFNTVLNLILIPNFGAEGCCIAALCSHYFCGLTTCIVATKKTSLTFDLRSVLIYFLTAGILLVTFIIGNKYHINELVMLATGGVFVLLIISAKANYLKRHLFALR